MRWILCAKNDAGIGCLEHLIERGDDVWAVGVAGGDGRDGWQRSFRAVAERRGVRFDRPARINAPDFVRRLAQFRAAALISVQYDQILRRELLQSIGCPCLNFHFALLPRHRGVAPIGWAVFAGDADAGVTLHHMSEDIDAGDVIARRAVPIGPEDTAREVYDKVSAAAVALFRECHPFSIRLLATRLPQNVAEASYHGAGDFDFSQRRVDWSRPAAELQRWIRAMIFPPLQYPEITIRGRLLYIARIGGSVDDPVLAPSGQVVAHSAQGLDVATAGGRIQVRELIDPAEPQAANAAIMGSIQVGDHLR